MDLDPKPWRVFDAPAEAATDTSPRDDRGAGTAVPSAIPPWMRVNGGTLAAVAAAAAIAIVAIVLGLGTVPDGDGIVAPTGSDDPLQASELVVDIGGAVVRPGVYRFAPGARVGDVIEAAGGFSPRVAADAVHDRLNLAATVSDGQRISVPSRDDAPAATAGASSNDGGTGGGTLVDLNRATQAELEALPGIGPVSAGKIIESRRAAPFRNVDELRERGLVGAKTFEKLKPLITVG